MAAANAFVARTVRAVPFFTRLWLGYTHNSLRSQGMEEFVHKYLPLIREGNPHLQYVFHRTHVQCDPHVVGEFEWTRQQRKNVSYKTAEQVLAIVEEMMVGGDYRKGRRRHICTRLPRGRVLLEEEQRGHDVFKVYSKWKADLD
uniref:Ribosomal protein/NADH dehydrogenase domain-containing protein n=1 Tax=Plectus sambesii TaxID=2011161 RepID=A0A914XS66_9BILA